VSHEDPKPQLPFLLLALAASVALLGGSGWYRAASARDQLAEANIAASEEILAARLEATGLAEQLAAEKERSDNLAKDARRAEREVEELEDLAKLDPELLAKYSRVFFLNENYTPARVAEIPDRYRSPADKEMSFQRDALRFLREMLDDAADDDVEIKVASAYRSFDEQEELKGQYTVSYGTAANRFSADQGYSEHQLGTTADFTTPAVGGGLVTSFEQTAAFEWLDENAYKYGFVLSYPKGNAYYVYEPWHWRFVGEDLARYLHREGKNFYDLDQRKIDSYLGEIFD
jgi:LAS superfamily LD-carboxypeptidase LdcB